MKVGTLDITGDRSGRDDDDGQSGYRNTQGTGSGGMTGSHITGSQFTTVADSRGNKKKKYREKPHFEQKITNLKPFVMATIH